MVRQFMVTLKVSTKREARWHLCLFFGKVECLDRWCAGSAKQMQIGPNTWQPLKASMPIHCNTRQTLEVGSLPQREEQKQRQ